MDHWARIDKVARGVSHPDFDFVIERDGLYRFLRVQAVTRNNHGEGMLLWKGRKFPLSVHMTDGEVVQTCFLAMNIAREHEDREAFRYCGVSMFDPHYDIDRLVDFRRSENSLKGRTDARS